MQLSNIFAFLPALLIGAGPAAHAGDCLAPSSIVNGTFSTEINGKNITVIGWQHPSVEEWRSQLARLVPLASALQSGKSCKEIAPLIKSAVTESPSYLANSNSVYNRLETTPNLKANSTIAIEASQEAMDANESNPNDFLNETNSFKIHRSLGGLAEECREIQREILTYRLLVFGPERTFRLDRMKQGTKMNLRGVENAELYQKVVDQSTPEVRNFNVLKENLPGPVKDAIVRLNLRFVEKAIGPSDAEIESVVALLPEHDEQNRIRRILRGYQAFARQIQERNIKIAENLLKMPGNVVLVIGTAHLPGLRNEFNKYCPGQSPTANSPAAAASVK